MTDPEQSASANEEKEGTDEREEEGGVSLDVDEEEEVDDVEKEESRDSFEVGEDLRSRSGSVDTVGTDDGGSKPVNRRESLRAKLRQSEAKLLSFTRSEDGTGGLIGQITAVTADLKKIEGEKSMLETELTKLQSKTEGDSFLQEKMTGIQEGFQKQVEKIRGLTEELAVKEDEIANLREDLVKKLRRIVELEFDLETHSVHFTNYAKEQFKLGEEALAEIKGGSRSTRSSFDFPDTASVSSFGGDDISLASTTRSSTKRGSQRKAQKLISKLLADLDDLEARYKADRLDAASELHKAQKIIEQLRTQVQVLEQQQKEQEKKEGADLKDVEPEHIADQNSVQVLRNRNRTLEAKRVLSQKEMDRLNAVIAANKVQAAETETEYQSKIDRLELENAALQARVLELEGAQQETDQQQQQQQQRPQRSSSRLRGSSLLKKISTGRRSTNSSNMSLGDSSEHSTSTMNASAAQSQYYGSMQVKIRECCEKIALLEAERTIKDRQISTLKNEVSSLRMREIASGKNSSYSAEDAELLRSPPGRAARKPLDGKSGSGDSTGDDVYLAELQLQLREAQQLLVKKDQELVIERAKSASTAAGLLARITELTSQQGSSAERASGDNSKLPLRFYL